MKNVNKNLVIGILVAVIAGGAGFFGGMKYQQGKTAANFANFAGRNGQQRFVAGRNGGMGMFGRGGVAGSIISMDDKSVTVKMADGSTKIVFLSDSTKYTNTTTASKSDLKTGSEIAVFGTPNSDGSVTASNVQLNPQILRMMPSPTPASQ